MRDIVVIEYMSVDGVIQAPGHARLWPAASPPDLCSCSWPSRTFAATTLAYSRPRQAREFQPQAAEHEHLRQRHRLPYLPIGLGCIARSGLARQAPDH